MSFFVNYDGLVLFRHLNVIGLNKSSEKPGSLLEHSFFIILTFILCINLSIRLGY